MQPPHRSLALPALVTPIPKITQDKPRIHRRALNNLPFPQPIQNPFPAPQLQIQLHHPHKNNKKVHHEL